MNPRIEHQKTLAAPREAAMAERIGNSPVMAYAGWVFGWVSGMETVRGNFLLATFYGLMGVASLAFALRSRRKGPG